VPIEAWTSDRVGQLAALVAAALPEEELSAEELAGVCLDADGVVLGSTDGLDAVAVVRREGSEGVVASIALLVVHPEVRGVGRGRRLIDAAERWARARGARRLVLGGGAPFYLWPGVDERHTAMAGLARRSGFAEVGPVRVDMRLSVQFRAEVPTDIELRRVRTEADVSAVLDLCRAEWPQWVDEVRRAMGHGTCHAVFGSSAHDPVGRPIGLACHSVSRAGRVGPMATASEGRRRGVGHALLGAVCRDLEFAEFEHAHVSWVGPVGFYEAAGAEVCARYLVLAKDL
jgi:GNAT superfamily N-acetyltransferase